MIESHPIGVVKDRSVSKGLNQICAIFKIERGDFYLPAERIRAVRVVSQDSFTPDPKAEGARRPTAPYYRVLVDISDAHLRLPSERSHMIPGMAVTAEMKVGRRSVISYFLYPLLRGLDESIREP